MNRYLDKEQHLHWEVRESGVYCYIPQDAIDAIGEVVFVEVMTQKDAALKTGDVFCIIETAKKCFELTVPFDGAFVGEGDFTASMGREGHLVAAFAPADGVDFSGENFQELEGDEEA